METTEKGFLSNDWPFKRVLRVSIRFTLIYAVFHSLYVLIFGVKPEIIWDIKLLSEIIKTVTLPWNSWINIIPNALGVFIFGISFFNILKYYNSKVKKEKVNKNNLVFGLVFGLVVGLVVGIVVVGLVFGILSVLGAELVFGLVVGLVVELVFGLLAGLAFGILSGLVFEISFVLVLGMLSGLDVGLVLGLDAVLALLITYLFSKDFWNNIGKGINFSWKALLK